RDRRQQRVPAADPADRARPRHVLRSRGPRAGRAVGKPADLRELRRRPRSDLLGGARLDAVGSDGAAGRRLVDRVDDLRRERRERDRPRVGRRAGRERLRRVDPLHGESGLGERHAHDLLRGVARHVRDRLPAARSVVPRRAAGLTIRVKGTIESAPELRGRAAVAGIAELRPSKTPEGRTPLGLIADASRLAIADAGLRPADVDGIVVCPAMMQYSMLWPSVVAEHLGLSPSYLEFVDLGGASSCGMIARAAAAVATGRADVVLCVNGDTWDPKGMYLKPPPLISPLRDFTMPYGAAGANGDYAMAAKLHMARYGTTSRQLAKIAADQRTSAQKNPLALFHGKPLTVDDVLASPLVCDPLHLLEVVMPCTGAEAVIVTSAERARDLPHPPALVLGFGEHLEPDPFQRPDYLVTPVVESARRAFGMAGVVPRDVDF